MGIFQSIQINHATKMQLAKTRNMPRSPVTVNASLYKKKPTRDAMTGSIEAMIEARPFSMPRRPAV